MKTMISAILFAVALPTAAHAAEDVKKTCCCKEGAEKMACCEEAKKQEQQSNTGHEGHQGK